MDNRPAVISPSWWIALVVSGAIVAAILAVRGYDRSGLSGSKLGDRFEYQIDQYKKIDPALIRWEEKASFNTQAGPCRALAVGPQDEIFVAGDKALYVFDRDGVPGRKIATETAVHCLAVGGSNGSAQGRIYLGLKDHVELRDAAGKVISTWESLGPKAVLTSIALTSRLKKGTVPGTTQANPQEMRRSGQGDSPLFEVFVADAGSQMVYRYNSRGKQLGRIGERDSHSSGGFVVPSPFFDVAAAPDGRLYIVNPGALRIETYTPDGTLWSFWGESSATIEGFFGCCNPAHIAVLPDGRIVTAEKGLLRVKVFAPDGTFDGVVAGPAQLDSRGPVDGQGLADHEFTAVDVAADSRGRVLVLDRNAGRVRIFEEKGRTGIRN
jgi:hypothetical protein